MFRVFGVAISANSAVIVGLGLAFIVREGHFQHEGCCPCCQRTDLVRKAQRVSVVADDLKQPEPDNTADNLFFEADLHKSKPCTYALKIC